MCEWISRFTGRYMDGKWMDGCYGGGMNNMIDRVMDGWIEQMLGWRDE